ncbi:ABC transporter permease [Taylorella equigenitalis]|uniref:ABC transporter permease n=1 Tax=Taylorella equigenitalis TaxID=29575 RepID=UPI0039EF26D8
MVFIILIISVLPTARLVLQVLMDIAEADKSSFSKIMAQSSTWTATFNSLYTSGLAMLLSLIIGGSLALLITLTNVRFKSFFVMMFMLPMMIPPQVMALSWLQLMGPNSALLKMIGLAPDLGSKQPLYSDWGIILLLGIQSAPLVFLTIRTNILNIPKELIEAARLSGASLRDVLVDMILPLCKNAIVAAAAIAFISALGNFGIPAMLGIPASFYVLPTLVYQKMADFGPTMIDQVASISVLIASLSLIVVWLQNYFQRKMQIMGLPGKPLSFKLGKGRIWIEGGIAIFLTLILVVPLIALVISSLVPAQGVVLTWDTLSLHGYANLFTPQSVTWRAFKNSFFLSIGAAMCIVMIGIPLALWFTKSRSRLVNWLQIAMDVPYALPGVVLSIAVILLFARPLPLIDIVLYGTIWTIFFAYLSRFFTVGFKPIESTMMQMDDSFEEAAQLCGAGRMQRLRDIIFPLLVPASFAGMILVFLLAFNELTVSALLWSFGNETVGVLIFNMEESGDGIMASAMSVVVVAIVVLLMLVLDMFSRYIPKGVIPWRS